MKRKRKLTRTDAEQVVRRMDGARQRELTARHLLLHPELIAKASASDLAALREYISRKGWRSLYGHDRRMYRLLRAGVEPCLAHLMAGFAGNLKGRPQARAAGERLIKLSRTDKGWVA